MVDLSFDFRLFRYALASAEHGSFRKAAAAFNIQQSSVSRGVRALEHRIGAPLFERTHAGIRPTPEGERFLQEAAQGFEHLERALRRMGAVQRGENGELTVATSVPFLSLGEVFERFRNEYPGVALEIIEETCSGSAMLVKQRKAEIAFVTNVPANGAAQSQYLRDEQLIAILPTSHRLARAPAVALDELRGERFILGAVGLGPAVADYLQRKMGRFDSRPDLRLLRVGQCNLIDMVARGFGITIITGYLRQTHPDGIVLTPLAEGHSVPIHAIWLSSTANPALKRLLKIVRASSVRG